MKLLRHRVPMPFVLVLPSTLLVCALSGRALSQNDERPAPGHDATAAATAEPACRLRIVDRTGAAVVAAEVAFVADERTTNATQPMPRRSDDEGFVDLRALPDEWLQVSAQKGSLYGIGRLRPTDWARPHIDLRVEPDIDVRFRVVDDRGKPQADLRVVVEAMTLPTDEGGGWREVAVRESDGDGRVVVRHAQTFGCWPSDGRRWLRARVDLLGAKEPATPFALEDLGEKPFVLTCPANGRIVVRPWRRAGQPSSLPKTMPLEVRADGDSFARAAPIERRRPEVVLAAPLARGWHLRSERHAWVHVRGPTTADEVVVVDLFELAKPWFALSLRATDDSPLVGYRLVDASSKDAWWIDEASDAQGRLRRPWLATSNVARTYLVFNPMGQPVGSVELRLPAGDEEPTDDVDLGSVAVQPFPRWLTGVVLDEVTQQPLAATLTCLADSWWLQDIQTDAQGRFALHAPPHAELEIHAHAPDHAAGKLRTWVHREPPRKERRILLKPAKTGAVRLEVLHDAEVSPVDWRVNDWRTQPASMLWPRSPHDGPEIRDYELESREPGRTVFLASRVAVGKRPLILSGFVGGPALADVRDLVVVANRLTVDPRLVLDLRGKVADARCRIELPRGANVPGVALLKGQEAGQWAEIPFDGELRVTLPVDAAVPMLVVCDEGLPVRTVLRPGTSTIEVPPLPECTVRVRGLPDDVPSARLRLAPFLLSRNEPALAELKDYLGSMHYLVRETLRLNRLRLPTDERAADAIDRLPLTNGTARTTLRWRGRYEFLLQVQDDDGAWHSLRDRTPEHVDIATGGEQAIELTVDPERVRALLKPQRPASGK